MLSLQGCCSLLLLLLSLCASAPLDKGADVNKNVNEVQNQEEELQSLLQLADEKSGRSDVTVHEEHKQHIHEVNGHKVEVDTARKTVSDTKTGEVLSDVKQEVSKDAESAGAGQPEVEVKTEVDVPDEGVHETIVQSGSEAEEEVAQAEEDELAFNPEVVAEYLYRTGDFNRFYGALAQLVNASVMTEEEAQTYSQLVALEYDRMQMEDYENSILVQRRVPPVLEQYPPVAMETANMYPLPLEATPQDGYPVAMDTAADDLYGLDREPSADFDPYELLYSLWNEAYGTGDARAEALVSDLFEKVRDDNDPDDEGQVKDILLDLIANSLTEDELPQPRPQYGWQPIADVEEAPLQPMDSVAPLRPIPEAEDEEAANELMAQSEKRDAEEPIQSADTKPAQPAAAVEAGKGEGAQPMGNGETKEGAGPQLKAEEEGASNVVEQAPSAPVSAQKRAAETV